ncbi:hypothetical protein B296_00039114 [Ensete ventricosum]|uniref:Uncharacterized protein n=1 Tax=Ensete ventricosum TaxID=4639 RepID=A0A426YSH3_ENSVE|nr:hypothetical protein B296_00039114 [Ensete ventricosum]
MCGPRSRPVRFAARFEPHHHTRPQVKGQQWRGARRRRAPRNPCAPNLTRVETPSSSWVPPSPYQFPTHARSVPLFGASLFVGS